MGHGCLTIGADIDGQHVITGPQCWDVLVEQGKSAEQGYIVGTGQRCAYVNNKILIACVHEQAKFFLCMCIYLASLGVAITNL